MISTEKRYNIDFSLLKDKEKKELILFYRFLLYKSQNLTEQNKSKKDLPETFYSPIIVEKLENFDRNEIYSDK